MVGLVKFRDVLAAARKLAMVSVDVIEPWRFTAEVAEGLGLTRTVGVYAGRREWYGFQAQVRRALNTLTDEGVLIKVGRGELGPDGTTGSHSEMRFYRPEVHARIMLETTERAAAESEAQRRMDVIRVRLAALGFLSEVSPAGSVMSPAGRVTLTLDAWDLLLDMAALAPQYPTGGAGGGSGGEGRGMQ